ncbi:MAG: hypothetical protein WCJ85_06995 [Chitinophagaceae bacterium]
MKKMMVIAAMTVFVASCSPKLKPAATTTIPKTEVSPVAEVNPVAVQIPVQTEVKADIPASPTALADGKITYEAKCGRCHALKNTTDFDAPRWAKLVNWMAPKAMLNETEKTNVLAYLQANAKQ